jgi:hypothetical protein
MIAHSSSHFIFFQLNQLFIAKTINQNTIFVLFLMCFYNFFRLVFDSPLCLTLTKMGGFASKLLWITVKLKTNKKINSYLKATIIIFGFKFYIFRYATIFYNNSKTQISISIIFFFNFCCALGIQIIQIKFVAQ